MENEKNGIKFYLCIFKNFFILILLFLILICIYKLTIFYIPFLIAYFVSIIIDPIIKFINNKTSLSRKTCSIIVLFSIFTVLILLIIWGGINLIKETTNLLSGLNIYLEKSLNFIKNFISKINLESLNFSNDIINILQNTTVDYLNIFINYLKNILTKFLSYITSIPNLFINIIITILATYFITSDKFYILDRLEHQLSKKMMGKIIKYTREITSSIGKYLKAEIMLSFITFLVILTGLNLFYLIGMNIEYPILIALLIGFVDALPILGAGSIMIPWSLSLIINDKIYLGISIIGLYILTCVIKQLIEPKLVSKNIGIHPIFTLISMYTGFKILGIFGLIIGPIILIILKNIFSEILDKGIVNTIFEN